MTNVDPWAPFGPSSPHLPPAPPVPPLRPAWLFTPEISPPRRSAILAIVVGAVAADLAFWTEGPGLGWTAGTVLGAAAIAIGARPSNRAAQALLVVAPLLALWCSLRTSPWLIVPDVAAVSFCLVMGGALAHRGRWFDQSLPRLMVRTLLLAEAAVLGVPWLAPVFKRSEGGAHTRRDRNAIATGILVAVPLVLVLVALLASADAVFASFFDLGWDVSGIARHVVFAVFGIVGTAALLRLGAAEDDVTLDEPARVSATVGNIVLAAVAAVFGLFAVSRLLALTGAAEHIATTRGLTWAEYARSGFFQLLAVAAITLVVLVSVCGFCDTGSARQSTVRRVLGVANVVFIIGIVIDAVHRLAGYQDAYGLTMLRLYSSSFAIWIAVVFVAVGVAFVRGYQSRRWLTPTIVSLALVALFTMNAINPEAIVAERNLTGATKRGETDSAYLGAELTDDAVPTILSHLDRLEGVDRNHAMAVCFRIPKPGIINANASRIAADDARRRHCPPS